MTVLAAGGFDLTDLVKVVTPVLALVAVAGALLTLIGLGVHSGPFDKGYRWVVDHRAVLTTVVAGGAMLGSLYFSEVAHFPPCRMCWFQRYFMYWIALVGVVALVVKGQLRRRFRWFALVMASLGILMSISHILIERGVWEEGKACDPSNPCSVIWFQTFGFMTLSAMALSAFFAIIVFNAVPPRQDAA